MGKKPNIVNLDLMQSLPLSRPARMVFQQGNVDIMRDGRVSPAEALASNAQAGFGTAPPSIDGPSFKVPEGTDSVSTEEMLQQLGPDPLMNKIFHEMVTGNGDKSKMVDILKWRTGEKKDSRGNINPVYDYSRIAKEMLPFFKAHRHPLYDHLKGVFDILKGNSRDTQEYENARLHMDAFIAYLINGKLNSFQKMTTVQEKTTTKEPAIEAVKDVGRELVRSFKKGDALDKAMMVGVGYMLYKGFTKLSSMKIPGTKFTFSNAFLLAGGYWGANYFSIKATGKGLPEHLGLKDERDDLEDSEWAKFTQHFDITQKDTLETMLAIGSVPMPRLLKAYRKNRDPKNPFINPASIGYPKHLLDSADAKQKQKIGRDIYMIINRLQQSPDSGGLEGLESKYGNPREKWTFGAVIWSEFSLQTFEEHASLVAQIVDKTFDFAGTPENSSPDIRHFRNRVLLPDIWRNEYPSADREAPGDGKFEMVINNVPVLITRGGNAASVAGRNIPEVGLSEHTFTLTILGSHQSMVIQPSNLNKMIPEQQKVFEGMMRADVIRRLKGTKLKNPDGSEIDPKTLNWDIKKGWYMDNVSIPTLHPSSGSRAGSASIMPFGLHNARVHFEGTGVNIDVHNVIEGAGGLEVEFINELNIQYANVFGDVASYLQASNVSSDAGTLKLGGAVLDVTWDGSKWNPAQPDGLAKFIGHPDFIKHKIDAISEKGSALDQQIEESKGTYYAMIEAESRVGHFFGSAWKYITDDLWDGEPPTLEGVSGSVMLNYATTRLDSIKNEIAVLYGTKLKELADSGRAITVADIDNVYKEVVVEAIRGLEQKDLALKALNRSKVVDKKTWDSDEVMDQLDKVSALPYKNVYYESVIRSFRHQIKEFDYSGPDKSDWARGAHLLRERLMSVMTYYTADFALDTDLDHVDFASHRAGSPDYNQKRENIRKQMYLEYVSTQIFNKALEFGGKDRNIDVVVGRIPNPASREWNIEPYENWKKYAAKHIEDMYKLSPKLDAAQIEDELKSIVNAAFNQTMRTGKFTLADTQRVKDSFLDPTFLANEIGPISNEQNRGFQQVQIDNFKRRVLGAMNDDLHSIVPPSGSSWFGEAWTDTKEWFNELMN